MIRIRPGLKTSGLSCRIGVDVPPVGASLAVTLDAPTKKVEALVDVGDHRLGLRQAKAHRRQDRRHRVTRLICVLAVTGHPDPEIVRIPDQPAVGLALLPSAASIWFLGGLLAAGASVRGPVVPGRGCRVGRGCRNRGERCGYRAW
jgi:hypothetical protein